MSRDSLFKRLPYPNMVIFSHLLCKIFCATALYFVMLRTNDSDGLSIFFLRVILLGLELGLGLGF